VKSVLAQTYRDIELVIIDDGSTDHSPQVLEGLKSDRRVRIVTTPNAGQAAALNLGISLARGEYIGFIDADDEYDSNHVETLIEACEKRGLDVAFAGIDIIQCGSQTHFIDYYDRKRLIPISEVDCVTGAIFGKRSVLTGLGFVGDYLDIDLYHRVTTSALKWAKFERKTYRYYFGRCEESNSARMVEEAGLGSEKRQG
jgi:glycosyltransferase involved in cell wall biosynthesis